MSSAAGSGAELRMRTDTQTAAAAAGWRTEMRERQSGRTAGRMDVYIIRCVISQGIIDLLPVVVTG